MTISKPGSMSHVIGASLMVALVIMYAVVPAWPEMFGIAPRSGDLISEYLTGAALLLVITAGAGYATRNMAITREPTPIHPAFAFVVFALGCYWLSGNSWVLIREGFEGSISAVFRILWFIIIINLRRTEMPLPKRLAYVVATCILMALDQSRTYFLIALLILLTDLGFLAIVPAIILALLVAAIRSNENYGFIYSLMFAVGGEGYLGSQGVFQVLSIGDQGTNFWIPSFQAIFAPLTATATLFAKRFGYEADLFDSSSYLGLYIKATTGETYPPMGGFFILSEFIRAGWFGIVCMTIYIFMTVYVTKRLFDTVEFPIGSFIAILAIKNSPATYWNLVIVVFALSYAIRFVSKFIRSASERPAATRLAIGTPL